MYQYIETREHSKWPPKSLVCTITNVVLYANFSTTGMVTDVVE